LAFPAGGPGRFQRPRKPRGTRNQKPGPRFLSRFQLGIRLRKRKLKRLRWVIFQLWRRPRKPKGIWGPGVSPTFNWFNNLSFQLGFFLFHQEVPGTLRSSKASKQGVLSFSPRRISGQRPRFPLWAGGVRLDW